MIRSLLGVGGAMLILAVIAAAMVAYSYYSNGPWECSLGVYGTAANVTISGQGAGSECKNLMQTSLTPNNTTVFYSLTDQPSGTILCEGTTAEGQQYVVRDTGMFDLVGRDLCNWMLNPTPNFTG